MPTIKISRDGREISDLISNLNGMTNHYETHISLKGENILLDYLFNPERNINQIRENLKELHISKQNRAYTITIFRDFPYHIRINPTEKKWHRRSYAGAQDSLAIEDGDSGRLVNIKEI